MNTTKKITSFIEETFLFGDKIHINAHQSLTKNNIVDSTGVLELISFIEENYPFSVNDDDITPENFDSLHGITNYIENNIS